MKIYFFHESAIKMVFKILTDFVVLVHFLWIVFLFLGAIWGVRYRAVKLIHLSGFLFAILIQVFGWYCPLTYLEVWLRSKDDTTLSYTGSFIIHYVEKVVYLELSHSLIFMFTVFLCALNGWLYLRNK